MSLKRRQYTKEFKREVLRELESGLPLSQVAREQSVSAKLIVRWQEEYAEYGEEAFSGNGRSYKDQARIAELERAVGRQTLEVIYLQRLLRRYQQTEQTPLTQQSQANDVQRGEP
jgi:transposase